MNKYKMADNSKNDKRLRKNESKVKIFLNRGNCKVYTLIENIKVQVKVSLIINGKIEVFHLFIFLFLFSSSNEDTHFVSKIKQSSLFDEDRKRNRYKT
jgi:hypothetical protein